MARFKSLTLRNFMSFGKVDTVIDLDIPGTTLVIGEDLDSTDDGVGGNGCGKTTIINAFTFCLYDKTISSISKDNLVNNINKKNMMVAVVFERDDDTYKVVRARRMKAGASGNYVHLFKNGKDITSMGNVNENIANIIGVPYELFVRIVTFSANHVPFLDLPVRSHYAANQTDIIEELFALKTLSEKAVVLKDQIKQSENSLKLHTTKYDHLTQLHDQHNDQVTSTKRRLVMWNNTNEATIKQIEDKLEKTVDVDINGQQELHNAADSLQHNITTRESTHRQLTRDKKKISKQITGIENEITELHEDKCPYCHQQYDGAADKKEICKKSLLDINAELVLIENSINESTTELDKLNHDLETVLKCIVVDDIDELIEIKSKTKYHQKRISELKVADNPFVDPLQDLLDKEMEKLSMETINDLKDVITHQKFLLKLLTKKDSFIRKNLITKNIPFLNERLSGYLNILGLPHSVEFTQEMTASISQFGRPLDFGNLSNGQRARVNIALSFAFRDVLQRSNEHINVCLLDEVLDVGLDAVGILNACKILKQKARSENLSMFIISHRDEVHSIFERKMTVQLHNNFSSILVE